MSQPNPSEAASKLIVKPKLVTFHQMIPTARMPQRADRSAAGSLPTRAFRYCEPATSASAFGYYLFPPIGFSVQWDGYDMMWTFDGAGDWFPLNSAVQFPGFRDHFNSVAPDEIKEFSPPFLGALQEPGLIQIWMGLVVVPLRVGACWFARLSTFRVAAAGKRSRASSRPITGSAL